MTTYFSQYEKAALQNNIRRKEDQVQALRYGNAMRSAVSIDMMYMFIISQQNQNSIIPFLKFVCLLQASMKDLYGKPRKYN